MRQGHPDSHQVAASGTLCISTSLGENWKWSMFRGIGAAISMCTVAFWQPWALAQDYPSRPLRLIVPFPPGGGTDLIGRATAKTMSEALGQSIIVENRAGAGGTIGITAL